MECEDKCELCELTIIHRSASDRGLVLPLHMCKIQIRETNDQSLLFPSNHFYMDSCMLQILEDKQNILPRNYYTDFFSNNMLLNEAKKGTCLTTIILLQYQHFNHANNKEDVS